ncbi:MAG: hypothetical protein JJ959_12605 [Nisaea sp.]|uniref:ethylbenzene dehydrogenase-related protein n=1 Tax=Nisaea sp. TaxID=2024842 RepID=UPI001B1B9958|nr:ethylbenzene dehydrogenase-related protein [Nisaea sp.]MBO6561375.1 hypothetical protein [Nisaea sp.]
MFSTFAIAADAETVIETGKLASAPALDGKADDWSGVSGTEIALTGEGGVDKVTVKAAVVGDMIYFLAQWADATESSNHKPYEWDEASGKYKRSRQLEDRLAFAFPISGDFAANHVGGNVMTTDVWHWKAFRSNEAGLAHDKSHVTSTEETKKAKKFKTEAGGEIYLSRPSDEGDKLYKAQKHKEKVGDVMPSYEVNKEAKGSIADVKAKGVWSNGMWTLEMARKLDTGHADDAVIPASGDVMMAIAAFNDIDGEKHSVSKEITLRVK